MGACSSTLERNINYLTKNNVNYTQALWNICLKNEITYIYASSAATYGNGEFGYEDEGETIHQLKPLNPYGDSKQQFDLWALSEKNAPKKWFGLKFFNVFGPMKITRVRCALWLTRRSDKFKMLGLFNYLNLTA